MGLILNRIAYSKNNCYRINYTYNGDMVSNDGWVEMSLFTFGRQVEHNWITMDMLLDMINIDYEVSISVAQL